MSGERHLNAGDVHHRAGHGHDAETVGRARPQPAPEARDVYPEAVTGETRDNPEAKRRHQRPDTDPDRGPGEGSRDVSRDGGDEDEHGKHAFHPKGEARRKERGYHPVSPDPDPGPRRDPSEPDPTTLGDAGGARPNPEPGAAGGGDRR